MLSETYITKPYDPQEHYEKFDQYDWYTICIPYDITKSMLLSAFGVNKEAKYKNKVKMFGKTDYQDVATVEGVGSDGWLYPDVRSLVQVKRSYNNKKVTLCLSEKLFTPDHCRKIVIPKNGQGYEYEELTEEDPIIKAGMPYLIRPYVPADTNIKNIGAYLCAYVSQLQKVKPELIKAIEGSEKEYAVPYEKGVETHALKLDASIEQNRRVYVMKDDNTPCKYNFVGSYVDRYIPQYGYYLGKEKGTGMHKFFRTTKTNTKWNRYSSIITGMSTPEYVNEGDESKEGIKNIVLEFKPTDDLVVLEDEMPNSNAPAKRLGIAFDDSGVNDLPTSIDEIDVDIALPEDSRIYTVNGTRVAADRLKKGIYIQNGKKIVVK